MAVCLEVDAYVEAGRCVVQVLYAGSRADDWELEVLCYVVCCCAVGVGGLDDADGEFFGEACCSGEIC